MIEYAKLALSKYSDFRTRSRRSEYWYFVLAYILAFIVLGMVEGMIGLKIDIGAGAEAGLGILSSLFGLAMMIPAYAVLARRLHDTGRSAWWFLIGMIPLIGGLIVLYFLVQDSQPGINKWGPNPKDPDSGNSGDLGRHLVD